MRSTALNTHTKAQRAAACHAISAATDAVVPIAANASRVIRSWRAERPSMKAFACVAARQALIATSTTRAAHVLSSLQPASARVQTTASNAHHRTLTATWAALAILCALQALRPILMGAVLAAMHRVVSVPCPSMRRAVQRAVQARRCRYCELMDRAGARAPRTHTMRVAYACRARPTARNATAAPRATAPAVHLHRSQYAASASMQWTP